MGGIIGLIELDRVTVIGINLTKVDRIRGILIDLLYLYCNTDTLELI